MKLERNNFITAKNIDNITKILQIFLQDEMKDENKDIKLILLKDNQVVYHKTLHVLQFELKTCDVSDEQSFDDKGSMYYLYQLYILFQRYTIGYEHHMFMQNNQNSRDWDYDEIIKEGIRIILCNENNISLSVKYVELPILLRQAYIEYLKSKVEVCMQVDSAFMCLNEYYIWLLEQKSLDHNNQEAIKYFQNIEELESQFQH